MLLASESPSVALSTVGVQFKSGLIGVVARVEAFFLRRLIRRNCQWSNEHD